MIEFIFWLSIFTIFYAYFGYPISIIIILIYRKIKSLFLKKYKKKNSFSDKQLVAQNDLKTVSFIITAYNEEKRIKEKIKNSLKQDYPRAYLEIIVASDCSSDGTDDIVRSYADQGVKLVRSPERKGKENAQKLAVDASVGEFLVFSDVATILKGDGITKIIQNFCDTSIGCVSSEDKFIDKDGKVSGEGAYVKYEMFLRGLETKFNTLVGLSGSFFAARKIVCENWETDLQSDFNILLNSMKLGLRGISDSGSIGYYHNIADERKEFQRKVRTVLRGITVLMRNLPLFNIKKYGWFSWQLFSHKLCRWLVPFSMIILFISNLLIIFRSRSYLFIFILQIMFYGTAIFYYYKYIKGVDVLSSPNKTKYSVFKKLFIIISKFKPLIKIFYFFIIVNISILVAWINYFKGNRSTFWEPSER